MAISPAKVLDFSPWTQNDQIASLESQLADLQQQLSQNNEQIESLENEIAEKDATIEMHNLLSGTV